MKCEKSFAVTASLTLAVFLITMYPDAVYADLVWNSTLGRFVSADTEVYQTAQEQFGHAQELENKEDFSKALQAYDILFKTFPNTSFAQDSLLRIAAIQEKQGDYMQAFKSYQRVLDLYPYTKKLNEITEKQFRIGNVFLDGEKGRFYGMPILPALPRAIEVYKAITENAPFSEHGENAQFKLGIAYKKKHERNEAIEAFQTFISNYPKSALRPEAFFQIAEIHYQNAVRKKSDAKLLAAAKSKMEEFLARFPGTEAAARIREMIQSLEDVDAERIYKIGSFYEEDSYFDSARMYYLETIDTYPESQWAEKARENLAAFEDPEKFVKETEAELIAEKNQFQQKKDRIKQDYKSGNIDKDTYKSAMDECKDRIDAVDDELKKVIKDKKRQIDLRWESLERKKKRVEEKEETLKAKEEWLAENYSEDLEAAIVRWRDSLKAEKYALEVEERELLSLERRLGIRRIVSFSTMFFNPKKSLEESINYKMEAFDELDKQKSDLSRQKTDLYDEIERFQDAMDTTNAKKKTGSPDELKKRISDNEKKLISLKNRYAAKQDEYEKSSLYKDADLSKIALLREQKVIIEKQISLREKDLEEARILMARLQKEDKNRLGDVAKDVSVSASSENELSDLEKLRQGRKKRKAYNKLKKQIYALHSEVDDLLKEKEELVEDMRDVVDDLHREKTPLAVKTVATVFKPFSAVAHGTKVFLFGLEKKEDEVRRKAEKITSSNPGSEEQALIMSFKDKIADKELEIKKKEREIIECESQLENMIYVLEAAVSPEPVQRNSSVNAGRINDLSADIASQESELRDLQSKLRNINKKMLKKLDNNPDVSEDMISNQEAMLAELEDLRSQVKIMEASIDDDYIQLERLDAGRLSEKKKKTLDKKNKKRVRETYKDILNIIEREIDVNEKYRAYLNDKLSFIEKNKEKMSEIQDEREKELKALEKKAFERLDIVTSELKKLELEKETVTQKLEK